MHDDRRVLDSHPLPIARGYLRYRNAREARERHDAAYYLFEIYLKYAAVVAIAGYLAGRSRDHRVNAVLKGLQRPSLGEWLRFLRECVRYLTRPEAGERPDPLALELAALLEKKQAGWEATERLYNALRSSRTSEPSERQEVTLEMLLSEVVAYRNRLLGHGAPRKPEHYQRFGELLGASFPEVLRATPFLTACRLVQFDAVQVEDGARLECAVLELMGQNPVRRENPLVLPYGGEAPRKGSLYLLGPREELRLLEPLLVEHSGDVYFLNEADGHPEYLSYTAGERHRPSGLGSAQGELFERILGYRVDSSQLGRIGEDVAAAASAAAAPPAGGERRLGDYRLLREAGRGAMGIVFEAVQESLGRRVALKVLPGNFALEPRRVERFYREARAAARVHHPSIVPVYEVGEAEGTHFYAMEFIDGPSLATLIEEARRAEAAKSPRAHTGSSTADPAYIARVVVEMASLAEGLEKAHQEGLVHRDVKPSNVLVDSTGRYVLVDFGLVREEAAETITRSGEMVGTLAYMSPEQVSRSRVDARADVYSLGATLYEALVLRPPFDASSREGGAATPSRAARGGDLALQRAILFEEPLRPRKLNPRLHRDLETIVLRALEKNPEKRYASSGALAKDLRRFLRYEPIEARPQRALTRLGKRAWKHRVPLAAAGAIALLLLASLFFAQRSREEARLRLEAQYGPKVLAAVMRIEQSDLSRKAQAGESVVPDDLGWEYLSEMLVETRVDPIAEAIEILGAEAEAVPGRPEAHYYRARALRLAKRDDEALADLARVERIDPNFVPALVLLAEVLEKRGEVDAGAKVRERARAAAKEGWKKAWLEAADALRMGQWRDAERAFDEIIALEAQGGEAYLGASYIARLGRGRARLEAKDYLGALGDFFAVESRWPEAREPVLFRGKAYHLLGKKEEAAALFEKLYADTPPPAKDEVAMAVSSIYAANIPSLREPETSLAWIGRIQTGFLRESAAMRQLFGMGRVADAVAAGKRAVEINPSFAPGHGYLGFVLSFYGFYGEALAHYRRAVELRPKDPRLVRLLGMGYWHSGRAAEAVRTFEDGLKLDPREASMHIYLGLNLAGLGEVERAETELKRGLELAPLWADCRRLYALFLNAQGQRPQAMAMLDQAIGIQPGFSWALANKGYILEREGKLDEAMAAYRAATQGYPRGSVLGHNGLAMLLEGRGKLDEALGEYVEAFESFPQNFDAHVGVQRMLRKEESRLGGEVVDRLVSVLDAALPKNADYPPLLLTLALARLRLHGNEDAEKALEPIHAALARKGEDDVELSLVLGEVLLRSGRSAEALAVLEAAARKPQATVAFTSLIEECRRALEPRLATPASIEAAVAGRETEVLLPEGALWRYFKGTSEPSDGLRWTERAFDDSGWSEGKSGLGYGDNDDATVLADMPSGYSTLYVRRKLTLGDTRRFERVVLSLKVDDGAVVYVDGRELGRVRAGVAGTRLPHDAAAPSAAPEPLVALEFPFDASLLEPGEHVLAIQGLNANLTFRPSTDFSLIPSVLGVLPRSAGDREKLIESVKAGAPGPRGAALLAFLEGLLLLEEGKRVEAVEKLTLAARGFPLDPIPHLRLARCLREAGDAPGAEAALRRALEGGLGGDAETWNLWAAVSLSDLKRAPAEVLAGHPEVSTASGEGAAGHAADVRWLLEGLAAGKGVRINCGGEDYTAKDGRAFGRDHFFLSGVLPGELDGKAYTFTLGIEKTEDDPLYQSHRAFPPEHAAPPGYRIPLPPGDYRVTLHFAEFLTRRPGWRTFGVLLEGREALQDYEPLKTGFQMADSRTFETRVDDGLLDLELVRGSDTPILSAIEVVRSP